jgi:hypothetical protein
MKEPPQQFASYLLISFFEKFIQYDFEAVEWRLQQVCQSAVTSMTLLTFLLKPLNPFVHMCALKPILCNH